MGDWNTLHHFDDKKFYSKIVPDLKKEGQLLKYYFNSEFGKNMFFSGVPNEERVNDIMRFIQFLDNDFKSHEVLFEIQAREKSLNEQYTDFIKKRNSDREIFYNLNVQIIEDLNRILTLIIFSECASFNPHLILGRKIFTGCVGVKPKSISEEIITNFTQSKVGSIFYHSSGFVNWITNEDLQLLWLDRENLHSKDEESDKYFSDFYKFIEIALENNLGVISGANMNEGILKLIESPMSVKIDVKALGLEYVINYE